MPCLRATMRSASTNAIPLAKRCSGRLARMRAKTISSSGGWAGSIEEGGGGGVCTWATINCGVAPENGTTPVMIS
jgi:hypothetical protein